MKQTSKGSNKQVNGKINRRRGVAGVWDDRFIESTYISRQPAELVQPISPCPSGSQEDTHPPQSTVCIPTYLPYL